MAKDTWNHCNICGQYISFDDFLEGKASRIFVEPSSYFSSEKWETYHKKCALKSVTCTNY